MSTRFLSLLVGLVVAAGLPAVALAKGVPATTAARTKAKVYTATLRPLRADLRDYTDLSGRARLVARGRRATITLTARDLAPRKTYRWAITTRRCRGARLKGFTYKRLKANRAGRASATGRSRRFQARTRLRRYVVVYQRGTTTPLICGRLKRTR